MKKREYVKNAQERLIVNKMTKTKNQRLKDKYSSEVTDILMKEFDLKNVNSVPMIKKVVINSGIGETLKNKEYLETFIKDMATITGQKPSVQKARISVATFGIRKGMNVGLRTTLRGDRMYSFLDRLFSVVLPRLRDFKGLNRKSFDDQGNYTLGIIEHSVFPEIDLTKVTKSFGMEITLVCNSKDKQKSMRMLELMGMPFEKE